MRKISFIIILLACVSDGFSQFYPFDSIPENLRKGAYAVIRTSQSLYTISAPGKAVWKIRKAVTLLNDQAEIYRYILVSYDKSSKVNYLRGNVYDEKGKVIKSLGPTDIFDVSAITGGSFYTDDRMKVLRFPLYRYPYTIEYEYEIAFSSILTYPMWKFHDDINTSVEKSGVQYVLPADMRLKYYESNLKNRVDSIILKDKKIYTWEERNIPAVKNRWRSILRVSSEPEVDVAPLEFEYGGIKGSMSSWKIFGEWAYALNKDRDALPDDEIAAVKAIASKHPDRRDQIKAVYEYMQSKTRYVSIQIGVGGFQSALATDVFRNGYGDCKALSNYTMALLHAAGIESYMTLVKAGDLATDINTSFVDQQFNHVILCVPDSRDTIWLECTAQTIPFNYLGSFTCDRHVLVLTPEGGKLVKTPEYKKEQNLVEQSGSIFFNTTGTSNARLKTAYHGYYYSDISGMYSLQSEDEMKRTLYSLIQYPDFTVSSASYKEDKSENPSGEFSYQVSIKGFGAASGKQIYFTPSLTIEDFLPNDTLRLKIRVSDITVDSITYWMPPNYSVESLPEDINLTNEFGSYKYSLRNIGERIILYRRLELNKGEIPVEKYQEFREFYNNVAKADRSIVAITGT
jgi:transglutaminase-like putative cysteine protease